MYPAIMRHLTYTLLCAMLLSACSGPGTADSLPAPAAARNQNPEAIARRVAAEYTGATPENIAIISVVAVEFSDSSLGCPSPDMAYLQVITPGHKVVVEVSQDASSSQTLDVRVSGGFGLVCEPQLKTPTRAR